MSERIMPLRTSQKRLPEGFETYRAAEKMRKEGAQFLTLAEARSLQPGKYWISTRDLPPVPGYYTYNEDGTLKKITEEEWNDQKLPLRVYISPESIRKASGGEGLLCLHVNNVNGEVRQFVFAYTVPEYAARVIVKESLLNEARPTREPDGQLLRE